jgi:hypothetical protein
MSDEVDNIIDSLNDVYYRIGEVLWAGQDHLFKIENTGSVCDITSPDIVTKAMCGAEFTHVQLEYHKQFDPSVICDDCLKLIKDNPGKYNYVYTERDLGRNVVVRNVISSR